MYSLIGENMTLKEIGNIILAIVLSSVVFGEVDILCLL